MSFSSQQKQRCPAIEELLVDLIVLAMERSEENEASMMETGCQLWHHLSSHLIFFVLFQFASFPHMVMSLYTKVQNNKPVDYRIACLNLHIRNNNFKYCLMWSKKECVIQQSIVLGYLSLNQGIGMLWFNFILDLNFIFLYFKLIIVHYQTQKQRKMKFKQKIKLNHITYKIFHYLMSWMEVFLDHTRNLEQGVNIIFL